MILQTGKVQIMCMVQGSMWSTCPMWRSSTAVKVQPLGEESHWNVDGELMPHNEVAAHVCQGAVQVFSRGIEVEHSVCA